MRRDRSVALLAALVMAGLFIAGLAIHGATGGVLLLVVAAVLVTLSVGVWGQIRRRGRGPRLLIVAGVIALAVLKFAGRW